MEHRNPRVENIIQSIEDYANDAWTDAYNAGYDESWDEARNKGYDEGWEDACNYIITKILDKKSGLVYTPHDKQDMSSMLEAYNDKGIMCVMMFQNYLTDRLQDMKVDKS